MAAVTASDGAYRHLFPLYSSHTWNYISLLKKDL